MKLTYSNVVATLALFAALGGGAYAATLDKNSVGSKQIKRNAVKGAEAKESSFATVPTAFDARNLVSIDSGLVRDRDAPYPLPSIGDLDLQLDCTEGAAFPLVRDTTPGGQLDAQWSRRLGTEGVGQPNNSSSTVTSTFDSLLPSAESEAGQIRLVSGTFTYQNGGKVIAGIFSVSSTTGGETDCRFTALGFADSP